MKETVKGFKDYTGEEAVKRQVIKEILIENFELYGFEPAETPIIEYEEFVKGDNQNDESVSDIFKLKDKGDRKLALRYESTFQLKRIAQNQKLPYKRYQIGEVFRDEPIKSNRFRQFTQGDVDIIGSNIKDEAEILSLMSKIFEELGIKAEINFNNRKLLNEILEELKVKNKEEIIRIIDKLDKKSENEVKTELRKYKAESILNILKNKEKIKKYKAYEEIKQLQNLCNLYKVKINFQPTLARGLSYYTGSVFEAKTKSMKETICGGGTYLINGIQSTGYAFGLERLSMLSNIEIKDTSVLIINLNQDKASINLAKKLRENSISCQISSTNISKALEYANSKNIPYVLFVGEKEVKSKKFKIKNMKTGKEENLSEKKIIDKLINN